MSVTSALRPRLRVWKAVLWRPAVKVVAGIWTLVGVAESVAGWLSVNLGDRMPDVPWWAWIMGAFLIAVGSLLEGSYRHVSVLESQTAELDRPLSIKVEVGSAHHFRYRVTMDMVVINRSLTDPVSLSFELSMAFTDGPREVWPQLIMGYRGQIQEFPEVLPLKPGEHYKGRMVFCPERDTWAKLPEGNSVEAVEAQLPAHEKDLVVTDHVSGKKHVVEKIPSTVIRTA